MEEHVKQIIELAKKHGLKDVELEEIPLYELAGLNSFQEFLKDYRVKQFLRLLMVNQFRENKYVLGAERIVFEVEGADNEYEEIGRANNVLTKTVDGEIMFNSLLDDLSLSAVEIGEHVNIEEEDLINEEGPVKEPEYNNKYAINVVTICLDGVFIISSTHIYADKKAMKIIKGVCAEHHKEFTSFLEEAASMNAIPHEKYIDWLMKWFPGKVHIRSLTY